jgi:hypothetical protein
MGWFLPAGRQAYARRVYIRTRSAPDRSSSAIAFRRRAYGWAGITNFDMHSSLPFSSRTLVCQKLIFSEGWTIYTFSNSLSAVRPSPSSTRFGFPLFVTGMEHHAYLCSPEIEPAGDLFRLNTSTHPFALSRPPNRSSKQC